MNKLNKILRNIERCDYDVERQEEILEKWADKYAKQECQEMLQYLESKGVLTVCTDYAYKMWTVGK